MIIYDKRIEEGKCSFKNLDAGDTFEYCSALYFKLQEDENRYDNAIDIFYSKPVHIHEDTIVTKLRSTLQIESWRDD